MFTTMLVSNSNISRNRVGLQLPLLDSIEIKLFRSYTSGCQKMSNQWRLSDSKRHFFPYCDEINSDAIYTTRQNIKFG